MLAHGRFVVDPNLAKTNPARKALEEAIALRHLAQRGSRARRQQAEIAGVFWNFVTCAPVQERIERAYAQPPEPGFVLAMSFGRVDDVIPVIEPARDERIDQVRRMLSIAVHEQHRSRPGVIKAGKQRGLLAEIS